MVVNTPRTAAAKKIQALFRRKRVFSENPNIKILNLNKTAGRDPSTYTANNYKNSDIRFTKPSLVSSVSELKTEIDLDDVLASDPKGFTEVQGYTSIQRRPVVRYTKGTGWIGDVEGVRVVTAKRAKLTVMLTKDTIKVSGFGNFEEAYLWCVKNDWAPKSILDKTPVFKIINGRFNVNRKINLEFLAPNLNRVLPESMLKEKVRYVYDPEIKASGLPNVTLKLKTPKFTYQFFENGTVLFSGPQKLAQLDLPQELFRQFFTKYNLNAYWTFKHGAEASPPRRSLPAANANAKKKKKLAERYPSAGTWNKLVSPVPTGYYIRPGTDGQPRLYPYQFYRQLAYGPAILESEVPLAPIAPKVVKAFAKVGKPIPASTLKIFRNAGAPLETTEPKAAGGAHANRRAPSWNATKNGFYVRPGAGQQPYWFKIPAGIASGRKTVIAAYAKAGRNIPKAVREIFKIGANVQTEKAIAEHRFNIGLNNILRINNRQATRLTKAELLAVARNLQIAQVSEKMAPANIIAYIQNRALPKGWRATRAYNVAVKNVHYAFLGNGRIQKTVGNKRTSRNWATVPTEEQNAIAQALLPANARTNWNSLSKANRYQKLLNAVNAKLAATKAKQAPARQSPQSSVSSLGSLANFGAELEAELGVLSKHEPTLRAALGNYYKNQNSQNFNKILKGLPVIAKGKGKGEPKKANVEKALKNFTQKILVTRRQELIRENYAKKLKAPNWLPANLHSAYKKTLLNLATTPNAKGRYPIQKNLKTAMQSWINRHVPKAGRAAHNVENAITGEIRHVPEWHPPANPKVNIPKRLSPARPKKKSPKPKKYNPAKSPRLLKEYALPRNKTGLQNLNNALTNLGLATGPTNKYTWGGLVRAGLDPKFRNVWLTKVASPKRN